MKVRRLLNQFLLLLMQVTSPASPLPVCESVDSALPVPSVPIEVTSLISPEPVIITTMLKTVELRCVASLAALEPSSAIVPVPRAVMRRSI